MDKIKRLDENLKSRINESKNARNKVQFKSAADVQSEIDRLQKQVDSGTMKIVDEKKALADISQLNRQKKGFAGFDEAQKGIDDVKAQIAELRKQLDDPESRALSERYNAITTELDAIRAEQDDAFKSLNSLRDERTKAHEDQQKKYTAVKEIKDAYYQQRRAAVEYEREGKRIREEKRRAENDAYHRGRRQEAAQSKLEDASAPAYQDEIRTTQAILAHLDPSSVSKQEAAGPGKFAATASRTVEGGDIKGTALKKKGEEEEVYFMGGGGKKNKRARGQQQANGAAPAAAPERRFNLDLGTIDSLAKINVDPPMSQAEVPAVVEKLREKLDFWKKDQDRKTKEVSNESARCDIECITDTSCRTFKKPRMKSIVSRRKPPPSIRARNLKSTAARRRARRKSPRIWKTSSWRTRRRLLPAHRPTPMRTRARERSAAYRTDQDCIPRETAKGEGI